MITHKDSICNSHFSAMRIANTILVNNLMLSLPKDSGQSKAQNFE